jgi:hypothetical protein
MDGSNIHYIIYLCRNTQYKCRILLDNIYHFRGPLTNKIKNVKLRRFGEGKYPICLRRVIIYSVLFIYSDLKYHTQRSRESMRAILIDSISIFGQVFLFFFFSFFYPRLSDEKNRSGRQTNYFEFNFLLERQWCIDSDLNAVDFFFSSSSVYVLVYIYIRKQ